MTPANDADRRLAAALEAGVASRPSTTACEIGAASASPSWRAPSTAPTATTSSRSLAGLPPDVAAEAKEAPALALQAAGELGDQGTGLADAPA